MKKLIYLIFSAAIIFTLVLFAIKKDPVVDFINMLDSEMQSRLIHEWDDPKKEEWHFFPGTMYEREGVSVEELSDTQKDKLFDLLRTYLSKKGYEKTRTIMGLEEVLRSFSGDSVLRNPENYHIAFYGDPRIDEVWAWSFEGHHVSLNYSIVDDKISTAPRFFGSNPAKIPKGEREGERTLHVEEDLGFELVNSFSEEQLEKAIFRDESYKEIVTINQSEVEPIVFDGISYAELDKAQKKLLIKIVDEYLDAIPSKMATERKRSIEAEGYDKLSFGWVGAKGLGSAHYYRIQGDSFLIEFDNSQNEANHIHTVWRDFDGDFGRDILREHYATSAHHQHD